MKHLETSEKLSKENAKHLDMITKLERYIKSLKRNKTSSIVEHGKKAQFSAQTEIDEFCNLCDYPAKDMWELGVHLYECHTLDAKFVCNFCGKKILEER